MTNQSNTINRVSVLVGVFREREPIGRIDVKYCVCFLKNWLIQLQSLACPKFAEGTDNLETQAALMQQFKSLGLPLWNPSCWGKCQSFALFRGSAEWMKPTHIMEGNLLYSKSTNLSVNLFPKCFHQNI